MFTGIVEGTGIIKEITKGPQESNLGIEPQFHMDDIKIGDSISVDGVCLTVMAINSGVLFMDVSSETLSRTTLGALKIGSMVNLERAMLPTTRLGGHFVTGHVDGTGIIIKKERRGNSWFYRIEIPGVFSRYMIEKGSVAVDGISLTINNCGEAFFDVNIIPHTAQSTTILNKRVGNRVNIELDIIGKYVEKLIRDKEKDTEGKDSSIDYDMLKRYGFD